MKDDAPAAFLTITSLQLPDSPIPLIDSQAIARSCRSQESNCNKTDDDKDAIMDELLRKVVAARSHSEAQRPKRSKDVASKCNREFTDLEECTRRIIEGPSYARKRATRSSKSANEAEKIKDCICSEVSEDRRGLINIRKKTEVRRSSRSPSPEVTHIIRIAMKYNGQEDRCKEEASQDEFKSQKPGDDSTIAEKRDVDQDEKQRCPGVNVALDFTLNCSSLHLTSRDVSIRSNKSKDQSSTRFDQPDEDEAAGV